MKSSDKASNQHVGLFAGRLSGARRRVPWRRCFEACFNKQRGAGEAYLSLAAFGSDLRDHMIANNGSPQAKVRGKPGVQLRLLVDFHHGRKHLPIVTLKRVA